MKITSCEKAENCLDGEFIFKYCFDEVWTKESIRMMGSFGELRYYESFPIPMFQVNCPDGTVIKGLESENECRIIFPRPNPVSAKISFEDRFLKMSFQ
jgi:hypothetical protein